MLLWLRKILFYILLALYCILTPYTIMAGMGYVLQPSSGDGELLQKTGVLAVESDPSAATVWVNGKKFSNKTPALISELFPGTYEIRLEKKGYQPWQKKARIAVQKATRLMPVILLPQHPRQEIVSSKKFAALLPYSGDFKIFTLQNESLRSLTKIDLLFGKETRIAKRIPGAAAMKVLDIISIPESAIMLFVLERQGRKHFLLYDLSREKMLRILSPDLDPGKSILQWQPKKPDTLYIFKDHQLQGMDLRNPLQPAFLISGVRGMGVEKKRLYYLKEDLELWESGRKGEEPFSLSQKHAIRLDFLKEFSDEENFRIEPLKHELFGTEWFLFWTDHGGLASNYPPYRLVDKGVLGYRYILEGDEDKMLYWTSREIGLFDFLKQEEEDEGAWPPAAILYRTGANIRNAVCAFDNTHIIFQDDHGIWLLEAAHGFPAHVRLLAKAAADTPVLYHERQKSIYFLNVDRQLIRQKITG